LLRREGVAVFRTQHLRFQIIRALMGVGAFVLFFAALRFLKLADATVIGFSGSIFMAALAVPLLGERVGIRRWSAIGFGFIGVVVILQPGSGTFQPAALLALGSAFVYSLVMIGTRWLSRSDSSSSMVVYHSLVTAVVGFIALPFVWVTPSGIEIVLFLLAGVFGTSAQFFLVRAFRYAPVAVLAPFDYGALLFAAVIGFLVWNEVPDINLWIGAAFVIASGLFILHRETRARARANA
jgi:drug/metabolite transporter (DMT)-like permease